MRYFYLLFGLLLVTDLYAQQTFRIKRIEGSGNMARSLDFAPGVRDSVFQSVEKRIYHPTYDYNEGPFRIEIIDPNLVPNGEVFLALDGVDSNSGWKMYLLGSSDTVYSNSTIGIGDEQVIPNWGLLVQVRQVGSWEGDCDYVLNCIIEQSSDPWLRFFGDVDTIGHYSNWIRSGVLQDQNDPSDADYSGDPNECFESILGGTWAPWKLASHADSMASPTWSKFKSLNDIENTHSVDIIITSDQSKWTRCPVLEIADAYLPSVGNAQRFNLRMSPSVDINGNPDGSGTMGMSWFPGYAVNLETGERLNMAFGENSWLQADHGADMIWNPTSSIESQSGDPILGGGHYIYVFGHNGNDVNDDLPLYDEGAFIYTKLSENNFNPGDPAKRRVFKDAMWVAVPLLEDGHNLLESDVTVKLRVRRPYVNYQCLDVQQNQTHPLYSFNTGMIGTVVNQQTGSESAMLKAYPIPASTHLTVEVKLAQPEKFQLVLRSIDGKTVLQESHTGQLVKMNLFTSHVQRGIYVLSLESESIKRQLKIALVE